MTEAPKFKVGDGATVCYWTDRKACTVVKVSASGKRVWVQRDKAKLLNGVNSGEEDALEFTPGGFCGHMSGSQRYEYERDTEGEVMEFSLRKNGRWVMKGNTARGGLRLTEGRYEHYDYNF